MHPFYSRTLLAVPDTGDQLIQYELAPVQGCTLGDILDKFKDRLAAIAAPQFTEKAGHQICDVVSLKALTPVFFSRNELRHSSEFRGVLLDFPFLKRHSVHLIIFFICGRLGNLDNFPSPERYTQGHKHIECCDWKLLLFGSLKQIAYGSKHFTSHFENFPRICLRSTFKKEENPIDLIASA